MIRVDSRSCFIAAAIATAALAACSGSGAPTSPVASRSTATADRTQTTLVVHWPSAQQAASARRRRDTLSPSTQSISIAVNGGAPYVVNKPTPAGSPSSTAVTINAPVGTDSFTFLAYDEPGGTGNLLDQAQISQDIIANANNTVGVALDGVCAALLPSLSGATPSPYLQAHTSNAPLSTGATLPILTSLRLEGPFPITIAVAQVDADGNAIVNSAGSVPIALQESGTIAHVTIAPVSTGAGNNKFTLTPLTPEPDGFSTTFTASSPNCGPGTKTFPNSFALSTSAIVYVADSNAGILAFDQDGTSLATISTIKNITGLTYNTASSSLVAIEPKATATPGIAFQTLSLNGSTVASGTLPVPAADGNPSGNIAYNPANGYYLVGLRQYDDSSGNDHYGTVLEYAISGSTGTAVKPSGTNPFATSTSTPSPPYDPNSFAVLPNGNVVVGDDQSSGYLFDKNGNYLNASIADPVAFTLTLDTTRNDILEIYYNDGYSTNVTGSTLTNVGYFYIPDYQSTYYTASAYVANVDEFYGFSAGNSFALSAATLSANIGNPPSVLPTGAFSGITAPTQAVVVP